MPSGEHAPVDPHNHDHDHDHDHDDASPGGGAHVHGESSAAADGHNDEVRLTPVAIERYGVRVGRAMLRTLRATFHAPGQVAFNAEAMAHVGSPLPGRVIELRARLGDVVAKGDVLLIVESTELGEAQSDFLQRRTIAQNSTAAVELSRAALDRATKLYEQDRNIALAEVQRRELELRSAEATAQNNRSAATAAENKLHLLGMNQSAVERLAETGEVTPRFQIVAPLAGRVVEREVTLGELVNPDKEALIVLADTTTLWVLADVPDARLPEVAIGAAARVMPGGTSGHLHEGTVSYIAPMVDPRTRSAQVRVAVNCEHGTLRPGTFAQVEIALTDPHGGAAVEVVAVPESAIQTIEGRAVVFVPVEGEPNTFAKRDVTAGKPIGGYVAIQNGLKAGESFVAEGSFILKAELQKSSAEHDH